jgi:hypothetical protein
MAKELVDCLGRRRSPATTSAFHVGRPPRNRGMRYPADPPPVEEIIAVMRAAGAGAYGDRLRGVMVVCWRAGLRVGEALAVAETDLDPSRGAILIRAGLCRIRHSRGVMPSVSLCGVGARCEHLCLLRRGLAR